MKNFKKTKEYIISVCEKQNACEGETNRIINSKTKLELLKVVKDNLQWTLDNNLFNGESIKFFFSEKDLMTSGVGNSGDNNTGFSNSGSYNAGNRNVGSDNAGNRNAGSYNAGSDNAGDRNAGYSNSGSDNAGDRNAGSYNAGNRNAGYSNSGSDNAGDRNAGSYNAGNRNAGYSNSGSDNAGAFNNLKSNYMMFNKPSIWTYEDFIASKAFRLLNSISTTIYVPESLMSDDEKKLHPYYATTGGYFKHLTYKESFSNDWNNWSENNRDAFRSLPNFDAEIFEDITGVKS